MATLAVTAPARRGIRRLTASGPALGVASVAGVLVVWIVLFTPLRGRDTLALAPADTTGLHRWLSRVQTAVGEHRGSSPIFTYLFNPVRAVIDGFAGALQDLIALPVDGRPVPYIGWLGVVALLSYLAWVLGSGRVALLTAGVLLFAGLQGLWQETMETLALTLAAVAISLLIGIPLGVWAGVSGWFHRAITPVLDFMQIMPTFVYLAPLTLMFLIGPAAAVIATVIYAAPPVIRLTAHGIRAVPEDTREAVRSLGATGWQELRGTLLPMAKRTIVLGINQTIMCALAMVTIAALIAAPGLGQVVVQALSAQDVGSAFNAGLAIVLMAIVLDRATTAASVRMETRRRTMILGAAATVVAVWLSYTYQLVAIFPSSLTIGSRRLGLDLGTHMQSVANAVTKWVQSHLATATGDLKDVVTTWALNPLQTLLDSSPWWLTAIALVAIALVIGGGRAALVTAACLGAIIAVGLWRDSMDTLAAVLVATVVVVALGVVVGVWMGRSGRVDRAVRPLLDAAQTMPSFVYLVPFLALFAASRFTGIVAAIVYAAPVSIKIMADGIRAVPPETIEAARSAGSSSWQVIAKVQLPMTARTLTLATNQGLIYVLSMMVVAGLVGGGALGYDVVAGFSQTSLFGKGLVAGVAIVLLGTVLDRTTAAAARRIGRVRA
ncbi:ABC transporter permease subunit [Nocardia terpenica]|uniref:ABC transporter permease n=1 Tax=Nocardia terpenica TaxID=455432 RepID=UPI0018947121|nr:ABC transporter permease subunit [Nocardia terpenica]MBF6061124.1 ABC transporter permease subunit [Nocardia terpenica]MBF6105647.1 ABC transporter permease subunit [Nocardia terpenica]MBF6112883.1 ABC transporter permease subunit [Nocardia terpenica]MBF6119013.1 ABC transporter permease subunit [Nocardia terpenica]